MAQTLEFRKAVRKSVPMLMSVAGVSGSGKTYTALLLAAGIAGPQGRVGFIDAENGRGEMYTDSPGISKALPNGFEYARIDPPFTPKCYIDAITAAEKAGLTVCVVDSASHEWEGIGGCCEIAENNKLRGMPNWSKAKMEHKRFVNHCLSTNMHLIFCLRAREKVKIVEINNKTEVVPVGIQPICEKGFVFEMLVSLLLDEQTHVAKPLKVPEPLAVLFPNAHLITKEDGAKIRQWNDTGSAFDASEQLKKRARSAAEEGTQSYAEFFKALPAAQKKVLADSIHEELKASAKTADEEAIRRLEEEKLEQSELDGSVREYPSIDKAPDPFEFDAEYRIKVGDTVMRPNEEKTAWIAA